jgi:hypothetical protein
MQGSMNAFGTFGTAQGSNVIQTYEGIRDYNSQPSQHRQLRMISRVLPAFYIDLFKKIQKFS